MHYNSVRAKDDTGNEAQQGISGLGLAVVSSKEGGGGAVDSVNEWERGRQQDETESKEID